MTQVDDIRTTLTQEAWQDTAVARMPLYEVPVVEEGRFARFLHALAVSIAMPRRRSIPADRQKIIMSPTEMLAQNHPYLYLRVMCG